MANIFNDIKFRLEQILNGEKDAETGILELISIVEDLADLEK